VLISARKGLLVVRSGNGDAYPEVPLNRSCRQALEDWLKPRATMNDDLALFVGRHGRRLTPRSVDRAVRGVATRAGLELSAHVLRHTCVTNLVRGGNDLVLVARAGRPSPARDHAPIQLALGRGSASGDGRPRDRAVTADARVLQFPIAAGAGDYGRFSRELSDDELAGCFFFTDDDRARIAVRRSEINRLGFALQLGTVRYLGRFLENPAEVPVSVLGWTARELAVQAREEHPREKSR
jgi:Domain of unknown function (DUF4158)/Phage integrase family